MAAKSTSTAPGAPDGDSGPPKKPVRVGRTADEMAGQQRDISVSEFFSKNRHLLGFDNPLKALMTTVKEGVDNALDACEEAGILPEVIVEITRVADLERFGSADAAAAAASAAVSSAAAGAAASVAGDATRTSQPVSAAASDPARPASGGDEDSLFQRTLFDADADPTADKDVDEKEARKEARKAIPKVRGRKVTDPPERFLIAIEDNGPGIVPEQIGRVFGKLLYGSKFHRLKQQRGQQGIGISAAGMYGQLTTGKPVRITSRTSKRKPAHYMEVALDLQKNQPDIRASRDVEWDRPQGTRVEIELEAKYQKGLKSVDTYLRATALANPHVTIRYRDPEGAWQVWERATKQLPAEPREVQPHPYGVELGMLLQMLKVTEHRKLAGFLENEFSRVTKRAAIEICELSGLNPETWVARVAREEATALHAALGKVELMNPPTDCVSPIGEGLLVDSLQREYPNAFIRAVTRAPAVYRGNPFQIEVALAHDPAKIAADQTITLMRFANRVPLLYQQGACAISKAVTAVRWKNYGVTHPKGALPTGPMVLAVHVASVWVPFTSESKEAVASYDDIVKEIQLGVMECARSLGQHLSKTRRTAEELKKRDYIARYIPKISEALQKILEFDAAERDRTTERLTDILNRSRNL
ncbi:MAG: DNA topoisomerase VI subunit B [Planctomycetes bacterium]|nr:DNA topoisomerase VI subunit B [Planctomycetota bacterium]